MRLDHLLSRENCLDIYIFAIPEVDISETIRFYPAIVPDSGDVQLTGVLSIFSFQGLKVMVKFV